MKTIAIILLSSLLVAQGPQQPQQRPLTAWDHILNKVGFDRNGGGCGQGSSPSCPALAKATDTFFNTANDLVNGPQGIRVLSQVFNLQIANASPGDPKDTKIALDKLNAKLESARQTFYASVSEIANKDPELMAIMKGQLPPGAGSPPAGKNPGKGWPGILAFVGFDRNGGGCGVKSSKSCAPLAKAADTYFNAAKNLTTGPQGIAALTQVVELQKTAAAPGDPKATEAQIDKLKQQLETVQQAFYASIAVIAAKDPDLLALMVRGNLER